MLYTHSVILHNGYKLSQPKQAVIKLHDPSSAGSPTAPSPGEALRRQTSHLSGLRQVDQLQYGLGAELVASVHVCGDEVRVGRFMVVVLALPSAEEFLDYSRLHVPELICGRVVHFFQKYETP